MRHPKPMNRAASQRGPADVDAYLATLSAGARKAMEALRKEIGAAAPGSVESFSYGVPAIRMNGKAVVCYAAAKAHYSLFPMSGAVMRAFAADLRAYDTSKGTIRLPYDKPLPTRLVRRIVKARLRELGEREA